MLDFGLRTRFANPAFPYPLRPSPERRKPKPAPKRLI